MPMVRYQIRNEYGLSDPELYGAAEKDDPEALLEGVAMAGLVGLLRQLGDLAEFAAEIFHDLHEEVMAMASRGHGLTLRLHQLEAEFPSLEDALISQISLPNVTQNEGIQWHTNVQIDQNLITRGDMPRFVMDSYEECHGPPRLFTLDKFDVAGAGACLKRYTDPSFFKTELASSCSIEADDALRERKPRKIKKKAIRWKKGETLESLLISSSESPPSSENQSSGKALLSRVVKLKSRHLRNSDNNARKIYHLHLLELIESQKKIILEDSIRQANIKPESNGLSNQASVQVSFETEHEAQKMHKVYPIQEQNEASSGSEQIQIGIETFSSRQTYEKTMTDSDDVASEHENFVDALNIIESEVETDNETKPKSDNVSSSQKERVHGNLVSDSVGGLVGTDKSLELNGEIEFGEATEFFDNDDLMDVSSTSSLHSDGVHKTEQLSILHGNNLMDESKVPAGDIENELRALENTSTVDESRLHVEDLVCLPTQTGNHQEQTNSHLENMDVPIDASHDTSDVSDVILNSQEIKSLEETPILEDSLGSHEVNNYAVTNRSSTGLEGLQERHEDPVEVSQVELRNISEDILNLEEYLMSTRKDESISQDIFSHGGKDAHNYVIAEDPLDVHAEEITQDFFKDNFGDPNERLQHERSDKLEDVFNGEGSLLSNEEEILSGSTTSLPTEDATDLSTHMPGLDLEALHEIRIQPNKDPTTITSDDYMDNNSRSASIQDLEASSSEPHSLINIPGETTIQGSYLQYHMDNFIEPDEGLLDLGETTDETYRNETLHHCEVGTQINQFNESDDDQQYLYKDESTVLLVNHESSDGSLNTNCEKNDSSKLHELSINGNGSLEEYAESPLCTEKSAPFSLNEECEWAGDFKAGAKEEGTNPVDFLWELTGSPREGKFEPEFGKPQTVTSLVQNSAVLQTDVALGSSDTSLHYEVGDHQVPEQDSELCYTCDANKVDSDCEEILPVEDGFAHDDAVSTFVEVNELLEEDLQTKSQEIFEEGKVNNEALVEILKLDEEDNGEDSAPVSFTVKNEVLVEALINDEKDSAEGGVPTSPVVTNEALVEILKLNEEGGVPTSSVVNNEVLIKTTELNEEGNAEGGVPQPFALKAEVLVDSLKINEKDGAEGDVSTSSAVNTEVPVETSQLKPEGIAEGSVSIPLAVKSEVLIEALKINEKDSDEGHAPTSSLVNNVAPVEIFELNEENNRNIDVPIPSVGHVHELLQNERKTDNEVSVEEESADTGAPTPPVDHVREILQEATNSGCHEPDTPPSRKYEEFHNGSIGYADLVSTAEKRNNIQSCTISLDNPLYDANPSENLSDDVFNERHLNKPVSCTNLHDNQEKLQEDINQIAIETLHNGTSEPGAVDPNKIMLAESYFPSSSIDQDQMVPQEGSNLKPDNILSGNKSIESHEVLANNALADVSVETKESEVDILSAYSLASEHKPPPLPPLGWRMGGKLLKGTSLPSNGHSSKSVDETNQNLSLQMRSMEAPPIANLDDSGRIEGEKSRVMSLSDLPPLSFQHELANPNLASVPFSGANVENVEYNNGSSADLGLAGPEMRALQYAWPDAQHPFLPVSAWTTGPSLVQAHQPGYLMPLEDNLWAQYGIGPSIEDERLGRKHHSIRNMPRNPLMDAVAAHDRSTMRKVSELVKPDDKSKAEERNSLLEQIRNKSFSLRPVDAPKITSIKAPQTNLKVAAIVEKANAIRQAFVGSDEEDGDSWSDA
ncbi:uncharacterized protein LOC144558031 isoform X3 [Carex rostrata]